MPLVKKLTRIGNSSGLILERAVLKQANLEPDAEVEIRVQDNMIVITPHRYASDDEARSAGQKIVRERRRLMERLARR